MRGKYEPLDLIPPRAEESISLVKGGKGLLASILSLNPDSFSTRRVGVSLLLLQLVALIVMAVVGMIMRRQRGVALLYGDSLVVGAPALFTPLSLVERMRIDSAYSRTIYANGKGGYTISDLLEHLDFVLEYYHPRHVIMLWDTDSEIRYADYPSDGFEEYTNSYIEQLEYACMRILETGAKLALSGPVLL